MSLSPHTQLSRQGAIVLALVIAIIGVSLTLAFRSYVQDDVFITYVYSRNIAEGVGFVFNPGELVQGTTTPLWAITMAGVYLVTPDLLLAGNILSGMLLIVCAGLAAWLLRGHVSPLGQFACALLIVTSPLHFASFGMETLLYCTLLMAALLLWSRGKFGWAMVLAGVLTWTRADGIVLGGALGLSALITCAIAVRAGQQTVRDALILLVRLALIYALVIAPWFIFAALYFGSPLPNTFGAKQEFLQGIKFLGEGVVRWQTFFGGNPLSLLALIAAPYGAWIALRKPSLRPLAVWSAAYLLGYTALNITNFWYYTPLVTALIVLAVIGADDVGKRIVRRFPAYRLWIHGAVMLVLIAAAGLNIARAYSLKDAPPRMNTYRIAGEWLNANIPTNSTLLVADLGVVGYYARRPTIDSFGLIVPDLPVKTPEAAIRQYQPDYVLATQYFLWDFIDQAWFTEQYTPVVAFSTAGDHEFSPMTVYYRNITTLPQCDAIVPRMAVFDDARWDFATLEGGAFTSQPWSGGTFALEMEWNVTDVIPVDTNVFVHLVDSSGQIVAQADSPLTEACFQRYELLMPPDLPAGETTARIGVYNWRSNTRYLTADGDEFVTIATPISVRFPGGSGIP
jgi:arabinofuranosyltransferase